MFCCSQLLELSRLRDNDMSSTTDAYNRQLDKCNRQIQEVSFSFFFNSSKVRVCLNNISKFSSCLTENTLYLHYKYLPVKCCLGKYLLFLCESNRIYNYTNCTEQSPSSKANSPQLVNKLPTIYVMFITVFKAHNLSFS